MKKIFKFLIPIIIIIILTIPSVYAFYFANHESSIISKFIVKEDLEISYVRATVLTYWVDTTSCVLESDLTTCDISGKSSWNLKNEVINSDWFLLEDGYYYYKSGINGNEITEDNIRTSQIALIDSELTFKDLTDEQLTGIDVVPQYEIIYEFILNDSIEDAWHVTYSNGTPVIMDS